MRVLTRNKKLFSHHSLDDGESVTPREIRLSAAKKVSSFSVLVKAVARIAHHNPDFSLFYRGQPRDYPLDSGASSCYPTIYREPGRSLTDQNLHERWKKLDSLAEQLTQELGRRKIEGHEKISKFPELAWTILQHYEVADTPLLDVTASLRVAASFALPENTNNRRKPVVIVFALPHSNGSISYSVEDELLNIKLLSICTPEAHRPFFQEGFLVGTFPTRAERKMPHLDFSRRILAKFELEPKQFWSDDFPAIPESALKPESDPMRSICQGLKQSSIP